MPSLILVGFEWFKFCYSQNVHLSVLRVLELCWLNQIWAQQKEINLNSVQQGSWEFFLPPNSPCQLIKTLRLCWYLGQEHCRRVPNAPAGMGSDTLCHEESLPLIPPSRSLFVLCCFLASHSEMCLCGGERDTCWSGTQTENRLALITCINSSEQQRCLLNDRAHKRQSP